MSKIQVDAIEQQTACGTTLTAGGGAGKTVVVDATTVTLGRCGGTVALASGASQTGFGRTGTVDWQTGSIKTSTFTAANGEGYFANTSGGAFIMNLPAGTAGNIVSVVDYTNTFQTNNLTISPNGSEKIGGINANFTANTEGQSLTFVYVDATEGWKNVQDSTSNAIGNPFLTATGGTITTSGNDKIHTFTGPGTFTVTAAALCAANNVVSHLVVAGGGGGGEAVGGGAGAGGFREVKSPVTPYTASPLDGYPSAPNRVTVTATAFPITVGAGGPGTPGAPSGGVGNASIFSSITSTGGGGGARDGGTGTPSNGGSGGGGGIFAPHCGGSGNNPPVSPAQGNNGGVGYRPGPGAGESGGGGGGATAVGGNGTASPNPTNGGNGGAGATTSITASPVEYAGGGGGSGFSGNGGAGGPGGGGTGGPGSPDTSAKGQGTAGTTNTGGGGGAGNYPGPSNAGGNGGSGIVVIRYKFK